MRAALKANVISKALSIAGLVCLVRCGELTERGPAASPTHDASIEASGTDPGITTSGDAHAIGLDAGMKAPDGNQWGTTEDAMPKIDAGRAADADVARDAGDGFDGGSSSADDAGGTAAARVFQTTRFTWAYDTRDLCSPASTSTGVDWPAAAGGVPLVRTYSSSVAEPRCGISTDGLRLDGDHTDRALDFAGGACWTTGRLAMPNVASASQALIRIVASFPDGSAQNRYLAGLWTGSEYLRWFHRQRRFYVELRTLDSLPVETGGIGIITTSNWTLVDIYLARNSEGNASFSVFINGIRTNEGTPRKGLGDLIHPRLTVGYRAQCASETPPSSSTVANQKVLFMGMALGTDSRWFDPAGATHVEDCRALGLCRSGS